VAPVRSRTTLATVVALITLATPAAAQAEVRSATQADPADQVAPNADLEQVGVTYDRDAGALTVTARLHRPLGAPATGHSVSVAVGDRVMLPAPPNPGACLGSRGLTASADLAAGGKASVQTTADRVSSPMSVTRSADGRELTLSTADARLAGLDLRCFAATVRARGPASSSDSLDAFAMFPGFGPVCRDGLDNDGDGAVDRLDVDCRRKAPVRAESFVAFPCTDGLDNDADGRKDGTDAGCVATRGAAEADPAPTPSALTISGLRAVRASATTCRLTVRMTLEADVPGLLPRAAATVGIRGLSRQVRTFRRTLRGTPLGLAAPSRTLRLRPGRYRFTARYPGARFRRPQALNGPPVAFRPAPPGAGRWRAGSRR
jgi:hypothetical protein